MAEICPSLGWDSGPRCGLSSHQSGAGGTTGGPLGDPPDFLAIAGTPSTPIPQPWSWASFSWGHGGSHSLTFCSREKKRSQKALVWPKASF